MIGGSAGGTLPHIPTNIEGAMSEIAPDMSKSILANFDEGGRPITWAPLKKTGQMSHLTKSGALRASVFDRYGEDYAEAGVPGSKKAGIHQFGGTFMHHGTKNGFGRGILIPPHSITIPQREYVMFQEGDIQRYKEKLAKYIITTTKPIPITPGGTI